MSQKIKLKGGKKTSLPTTESQPTALSEISSLYGASPEVLQPVSDATQYNLNIGPGQLTFKPFVDIKHTWRCGALDIKYGDLLYRTLEY